MLKVIVDRPTWYRGSKTGSKLLRSDGYQCCLGFACEAAGVDKSEILGVNIIGSLPFIRLREDGSVQSAGLNPVILAMATIDVNDNDPVMVGNPLYSINDDPDIDDDERERRLIVEGAKFGIEFSFSN